MGRRTPPASLSAACGGLAAAAAIAVGVPAPAGAIDQPPLPLEVVLPSGYRSSERSYPVVYLYNVANPGCTDASCDDLAPILRALGRRKVISVLLTDRDSLASYPNWRDGTHKYETLLARGVVRYVDSHYRTRQNRASRAVAGISAGGYGAMLIASRHPARFSSAASFSGPVDLRHRSPASEPVYELVGDVVEHPDRPIAPFRVWGNPVTDNVFWRNVNPADLAGNLDGVAVFHSAGNGVPCDRAEVSIFPDRVALEVLVRDQNESYDRRLTEARTEHTYLARSCGTHDFRHWHRDFRRWFLEFLRFGSQRPSSFDYRRVEPRFGVWGWRFRADPSRAPEFLYIRDASPRGLTLTGSGTTQVRSARRFRPGERLRVAGTGFQERVLRASAGGRIGFRVDLGRAHRVQQFTPAQRVLAAAQGDYFRSRKITIERLRDSG
jgi:S-formylglutathione hydrolase FrmB